MIKAIIFDCFGVIVGRGFDYTYESAGGDPNKDREFINEKLDQINKGIISNKEFSSAMVENLGISKDQWIKILRQSEKADSKLLNFIFKLRSKYKTAILSNANIGVIDDLVGTEVINACFDEVVVSAEVGLIKPDIQIYELVARKLGVKPNECVYIDDRQRFVEVGGTLGMQTILYKNFKLFKQELNQILASDSK